ncbi:NTF2- export protein 2 [Coemansia brasiliensis]|uniref:Nuclear transport factor 2 n=1 Tax=Coemansia brasiliensis TaxID=2650707 RepID=A0A9W8M246_9FUNG|nr:NTF2- export protein 2 [Coemansia brasiliensis]
MGGVPTEQRISQAISHGEKFVDQYYKSFSKSVGKFYTPESRIIWNGQGFSGEQFTQVLPELQKTLLHFDVTSYDAQPLGPPSNSSLTMINVSGLVKIDRKKQFAQQFVVQKTGNLSYIVSDCFRLV